MSHSLKFHEPQGSNDTYLYSEGYQPVTTGVTLSEIFYLKYPMGSERTDVHNLETPQPITELGLHQQDAGFGYFATPKGEQDMRFIPTPEFTAERNQLALTNQRRCNRCQQIKTLDTEFDNDKSGANGKCGHCKECRNKKARDWHDRNDGLQGALDNGYKRAGSHGRRRRKVKADRLLKVWKKQGIDPWKCFYTGVALTREPGHPNTRNLDHKEPLAVKGTAGHISTNIVPCAASFNRYKHDKVALDAYFAASEEHQPVSVYTGLAPGMVGVDFYGNPLTPVAVEWSESENKGNPVNMGFCDYLKIFHPKNDAPHSPVSA